ncbi:glycosyltransferase [Roseivirga seohaensis subsp. aquiponti]|uniref:Glycosyltransferase n=1 Tax=Roseivirga seohaensis subsp. aquiponti TaxID=1566026 RepID=A0A0L8APF5_9BACT|nr:TIGR04282 family arsenosugar biosynthesis glycosyltransferase [Roseivirga seohaensis]KOF04047.1 glycosyltransferase [Roseivirga seohaensis subsp. aquiponti]
MGKALLIIFVKNPELGRAKTRLAATVGEEAALAIYKRLLERTKSITQPLAVDKTVFYDQALGENDLWSAEDYSKEVQSTGDLGVKMLEAFQSSFAKGYERICIIGSDCYDLTTEILNQAFSSLEKHDAVIGEAVDGGYYLIGMNRLITDVFQNKKWSTEEVFPSTIQDFKKKGISYFELPILNDVDTEEDLGDWAQDILKGHRKA